MSLLLITLATSLHAPAIKVFGRRRCDGSRKTLKHCALRCSSIESWINNEWNATTVSSPAATATNGGALTASLSLHHTLCIQCWARSQKIWMVSFCGKLFCSILLISVFSKENRRNEWITDDLADWLTGWQKRYYTRCLGTPLRSYCWMNEHEGELVNCKCGITHCGKPTSIWILRAFLKRPICFIYTDFKSLWFRVDAKSKPIFLILASLSWVSFSRQLEQLLFAKFTRWFLLSLHAGCCLSPSLSCVSLSIIHYTAHSTVVGVVLG